jgi:hypothetical protein
MTRTALIAALLCACVRLDPVEPPPDDNTTVVVVPEPDPQEPAPDPQDPVTPCERSCARHVALKCSPAILGCAVACEASEEMGRAYSWQPELQATAVTCGEWNRRATEAR